MYKLNKNKKVVIMSLFTAIIFILGLTPLGMIPLGFIKITIVQVPVIIGSLFLGAKLGSVLGLMFGVASFISNSISPVLLSFCFSSFIPVPGSDNGSIYALFVCFIPRIFLGFIIGFLYQRMSEQSKQKKITLTLYGLLGSMLNTFLVMSLIYIFFKNEFANINNIAANGVLHLILTIVLTNGVIEAIISSILTTSIYKIINKL